MNSKDVLMYIAVLFLACVIGAGIAQPYFEAQTFNKFSDKKATYWDAAFADLRIEANRMNK